MSDHPAIGRYAFFCNRECEYFPCHKTDSPDSFNCLFCYCPLYVLDGDCGGNFGYTKDGVKDCSASLIPHDAVGYEYVIEKFGEIDELMKNNRRRRTEGK